MTARGIAAPLSMVTLLWTAHADTGRQTIPIEVHLRVTNEAGDPVTGLAPSDFVVRIGGQERPVSALELLRLTDGRSASEADGLPPPFFTNTDRAPARDVIVVLDVPSLGPQAVPVVTATVEQVLSRLSARDRVGVVRVRSSLEPVTPTTSRDAVRSALNDLGGVGANPLCGEIALARVLRDVFRVARSASATIMVFASVSGCAVYGNEAALLAADAGLSAARTYVFQVQARDGRLHERSGLADLADAVDGEEIRLGEPSPEVVDRVLQETSAYYRMTVDAAAEARPGQTAGLDVRLRSRSARVRAPKRIEVPAMSSRPVPATRDARALLRASDVTAEIPIRVMPLIAPHERPGLFRVVAAFEVTDPSVVPADAMIGLFDSSGQVAAQWTARPAELEERPVLAALLAPAGRYRLRVAVTSEDGRGAFVDVDLTVNAVPVGPGTASALVLGVPTDAGTVAPRFEFGDEQAVAVLLELHGLSSGAAISAVADLTAPSTGAVLSSSALDVRRAARPGVRLVTGRLPLRTVPAGDYVVRVRVASEGWTADVSRMLRKDR